jgi:DNA polymerase I-like protein with 3'-5' exonuclease and polymerase domains
MELYGIGVNREGLQQVAENLHADLGVLSAEVSARLPGEDSLFETQSVNLHSPDQVLTALKKLGLEIRDTSESSIRAYIDRYPFLQKLLEFRHTERLRTTVERQLLGHLHPKTGRIHATYHQIASSSGRYACADPNMQNVPRESFIRQHVVPKPGYAFIIADYSQVELRVAAGLSKDPIMCKAYAEGNDLHRLTAALTQEKYVEQVTPDERQAAKAINFGLIYAMGARGLQQSAKASYGVEMGLEQAETFRKRFFENYHGLATWQHNMSVEGKRLGYVRTAAGRIRSYRGEEIMVTELLNTPVQGTAAEGLKSAMCIFSDQVYDRQLDAHIVAIIHDEIIVEVVQDQAEAVKELLEDSMVKGIAWLVPNVTFVADAAIAESWAEK